MRHVHTLIVGSGAAGLAAAVRLHALGIRDLLIVTEGLHCGTSRNAGSDKQTYYKLGLYGREADSPSELAETLFAGGSMHGDLALVEAALSARCFYHLVDAGVPFPHDRYGQFAGYKTDHDPRRRATSCGPYTSREMCRALIEELTMRRIPVLENANAVRLLVNAGRICGAIILHDGQFETVAAANVVFAVGGPGGLYRDSVYPLGHTGAIGLALEQGAAAQNLPESQYGLASIKFRWNVSGTYMQVVPRMVSTAADGVSDEREFLLDALPSAAVMNNLIFLKGYQWPFDVRKAGDGSSRIDLLVYRETVEKKRRVFLDFRTNSNGFAPEALSPEALDYLQKSGASQASPLARLRHMNPAAIDLYAEHGIDLEREMLEIAVCAQHNNGGLAADCFYESLNIRHLFPIGEVNGSHGVSRPGGAALNAGQTGAFQAAELIAEAYAANDIEAARVEALGRDAIADLARPGSRDWRSDRAELQARMSLAAGHVREENTVRDALAQARQLYTAIRRDWYPAQHRLEGCCNRHLAYAHVVYLSAILFQIVSGTGSRGSALVLRDGAVQPENPEFRNQVLETTHLEHRWVPVRPLPETDGWFENIWRDWREKRIYRRKPEGVCHDELS